MPGGTLRNWESYGAKINSITEYQKAILADPQTSGGLLMVVDTERQEEFEKKMQTHGYNLSPFGKLISQKEILIQVL